MDQTTQYVEALLADGDWFRQFIASSYEDDAVSITAEGTPSAVVIPAFPAPTSAAEAVARARLRLAVLDAALALPEPTRTAVTLRVFEGVRWADIAVATRMPEEKVRNRVRDGLASLRAAMRNG